MKKFILFFFLITAGLMIYRFQYLDSKDELIEENISLEEEIQENPLPKAIVKKTPSKTKVASKSIQVSKPIINTKVQTIKPRYPKAQGPEYAPFDLEGKMIITEVMKDEDLLIIHGDILIGSYEEFIQNERDKKPVKLSRPSLWPNGIIPYLIQPNLPNKENILKAIQIINANTNVTFRQKKVEEQDYVIFKSGNNNCYSYVGRVGGEQHIILSPLCKEREILHELMHTLGFIHEQNREDRDQYVEILWHNIEDRFHPQFKKIPNHFLRVEDTPFDFNSIMLYPPNAFSHHPEEFSMTKIGGDTYPINSGFLSQWDVKRVNEAYHDAYEE